MVGEARLLLWQPMGHGGLNGAEAESRRGRQRTVCGGNSFSHEFAVNSID